MLIAQTNNKRRWSINVTVPGQAETIFSSLTFELKSCPRFIFGLFSEVRASKNFSKIQGHLFLFNKGEIIYLLLYFVFRFVREQDSYFPSEEPAHLRHTVQTIQNSNLLQSIPVH